MGRNELGSANAKRKLARSNGECGGGFIFFVRNAKC